MESCRSYVTSFIYISMFFHYVTQQSGKTTQVENKFALSPHNSPLLRNNHSDQIGRRDIETRIIYSFKIWGCDHHYCLFLFSVCIQPVRMQRSTSKAGF